MMTDVLVIVSLVIINGLLALAEIGIVASRKTRLQRLAERGNQSAKAALHLAESPADFLLTVQVGITLVGVLSGAFAGATIAEQLALGLAGFPAIGPYVETIAIAVVVVAITYLSLIFGELVPLERSNSYILGIGPNFPEVDILSDQVEAEIPSPTDDPPPFGVPRCELCFSLL